MRRPRLTELVVVFDLDDTLYDEITYVRSGFKAVAAHLAAAHGVSERVAFDTMWRSLEVDGRGKQLNVVLERFGLASKQRVKEVLAVYRHHTPEIQCTKETLRVLDRLESTPLYLVTDGHKVVQAAKLQALGIAPRFRHAYLTNRYGQHHAKPSPYVFELLRRREGRRPEDVVYVGDNPKKDFRGIRPLGYRTIRLRRGAHADVTVPRRDDAEVTVDRLGDVLAVLRDWSGGAKRTR